MFFFTDFVTDAIIYNSVLLVSNFYSNFYSRVLKRVLKVFLF